jgi:hypothetical protein
MSIGFTVMKRGYLPARIEFVVTRESKLSGQVVLKRDPESAPESQPYLVEFERLRYELSDTSRNEEISARNHTRIETLKTDLEGSARQALASGDKKAAARIYARMQHLPSIRFGDGKPIGFAQSDPYTEQSWGYLEKAYTLDPNNPYIAANYLFDQAGKHFGGYRPENASEDRRRAFNDVLSELHALMRAHGEQIWPANHRRYALLHRKSSNPEERERVVPLLEELCRAEPRFERRDTLMKVPR